MALDAGSSSRGAVVGYAERAGEAGGRGGVLGTVCAGETRGCEPSWRRAASPAAGERHTYKGREGAGQGEMARPAPSRAGPRSARSEKGEPSWAKGGASRMGGYVREATIFGARGTRPAYYGTGWARARLSASWRAHSQCSRRHSYAGARPPLQGPAPSAARRRPQRPLSRSGLRLVKRRGFVQESIPCIPYSGRSRARNTLTGRARSAWLLHYHYHSPGTAGSIRSYP